MKPWIKKIIKYSLIVITPLVFVFLILGFTTQGLKLDVAFIKPFLSGKLKIEKIQGRLFGSSVLNHLSYDSNRLEIKSKKIALNWSFVSLLKGELNIQSLLINDTIVKRKKKAPSPKANTTQRPSFNLQNGLTVDNITPFHFKLKNIRINQLDILNGDDRAHLNNLQLEAYGDDKQLRLEKFSMTLTHSTMIGKGSIRYGGSWPVNFSFHSKGRLISDGSLKGTLNNYHLITHITKPYQVTLKATLIDLLSLDLNASANNVYWPLMGEKQLLLNHTFLTLKGTLNDYAFTLKGLFKKNDLPWITLKSDGRGDLTTINIDKFELKDKKGDLNANGRLSWFPSISWKGFLNGNNIVLSQYLPSVPGNLSFTVKSSGVETSSGLDSLNTFKVKGSLLHMPLSGTASLDTQKESRVNIQLGENRLKLNGSLALPINIELTIPNTADFKTTPPTLKSRLQLTGQIGNKSSATLALSPGTFISEDGTVLPIQGGRFIIHDNPKGLNLTGDLIIDPNKKIKVTAVLPTPYAPLKKQQIEGHLNLNLDDLSVIDYFIEDTKDTTGQLSLDVRLGGPLLSPLIKSQGKLSNAKTFIKPLGIQVNPINLSLTGSQNNWQLTGSLHSGNGFLKLNGKGSYQLGHLKNELTLKGNNVLIVNTRQYKINVTPDISLAQDNYNLQLHGDLTLNESDIKPDDFTDTVDLPDDVVIINGTHPKQSHFDLAYQLNVGIADKVDLNVMGLIGEIKGKLKINSPLKKQARATGQLRIVKGKYDAYGQKLKITEGALIYTGGPLNNPGISLTAIRRFDTNNSISSYGSQSDTGFNGSLNDFTNLTVGIRVSGRLKSPKITLFSNPPTQSQADTLSLLLLGKSASQASSTAGGGDLLVSALTSMNLGGGSKGQQLTSQLKDTLGIDSLGIETQQNYNAETGLVNDNPSLVIGKSLSSKIYLQYSTGLAQDTSIMRIIYRINQKWSLQTETNWATNGIDIFYNFHRK
jgi:translocation and assembly module TamB